VYAAGDPVEAYAVLAHKVDFWEEQFVLEHAWTTARGYDAILDVLCGIAINKSELRILEPSDSPFLTRYADQGMKVSMVRPLMYRVLDVPGALRALVPDSSGEFAIAVEDPDLAENRGPWRVKFSPGKVDVAEASKADFTLSIQVFTQAFLGEPSLADLVRNGLAPGDRAALEAAQSLLPPSPVYCQEFF
jgi:predicted acetyltransferase